MADYSSLLMLVPFVLGLAAGWVQKVSPWKERVKELELVLEKDSAQKMERLLVLEQELRLKSLKMSELEMELERVRSKGYWKE